MYEKKVDKGSVFILVFLIVATTLGYLMVGGTLPTRIPGFNNNLVGVPSLPPYDPQSALQMRSFSGATITPYPTLANSSLSSSSLQYQECGHTLQGKPESEILWAFDLSSSAASNNQLAVKAFYDDEHALTLGSGTVSPMTKQPSDHISNPNVGDLTQKDPNNLPFAPSLFLTDITTNSTSAVGDGENGGTASTPSDVYGSWKALGSQDPQGNSTDLGGGDPWPASNGPTGTEGHDLDYTSEVIWKVSDLKLNGQPLTAGHSYRGEIVLHDGDSEGDIGEECVTITIPTGVSPSP